MMSINWKFIGAIGVGIAGVAVMGYGLYSYFKSTPAEVLLEGKIDLDEIDRRENTVIGHGYRVVNGIKKEFVYSFLTLSDYSILKLSYLGDDASNVLSIDEVSYFTGLIGFPGQYKPEPCDQGYMLKHVAV